MSYNMTMPQGMRRSLGYMELMLKDMPKDFPAFMMSQMQPDTDVLVEPVSPFMETPLRFAAGQPDSLFEGEGLLPYRGQLAAKKNLMLEIRSLYRKNRDDRFKTLLVGPAGLGKTTLGRIVAQQIQQRRKEVQMAVGSYIELMPAQISTKERLDEFFEWAIQDPYRIVLLDEVHTLTDLEPWFPVLHDTGDPYYPMADGRRLEIPKTMCWITLTTDPGGLDKRADGALRRRLQPEIELEVPSKADLIAIIQDQGDSRRLPVDGEVARQIVGRSMFPWQAKMIFEKAEKVASLQNAPHLTSQHVNEAFDMLALDVNGLLLRDRNVLRALLHAPYEMANKAKTIRYKMSEEALCGVSGVDKMTYKKRVQPKLMQLGFLTTIGGQCLTEQAVKEYGWLKSNSL